MPVNECNKFLLKSKKANTAGADLPKQKKKQKLTKINDQNKSLIKQRARLSRSAGSKLRSIGSSLTAWPSQCSVAIQIYRRQSKGFSKKQQQIEIKKRK